MSINPFVTAFVILLCLSIGFVIGTNMGIGMAFEQGSYSACEMMRIKLLNCESLKQEGVKYER